MRGLIHGLLAAGVLLGIPGTVLAAEGAPAVDTGDTAWVLISAALVMLMTPGLAFFYGGMVRSKNVLTTIMQSFFIVAMVSVQWVLFGFSLAFGPDINGVIGSLRYRQLELGRAYRYGAFCRSLRRLFRNGAVVCLCGISVHVCGNYGGAYYRRLCRTL